MDLPLVIIKGGGDLASGAAYRLHQAGFPILISELPHPLLVRRSVAFGTAILDGCITVEGVTARRIASPGELDRILARNEIGVIADPNASAVQSLRPPCLVDAIMAKANLGTHISDAPVVVALGPGFVAGLDVHAVVETKRGHNLGRVYYSGHAEPDSGEPAAVQGFRQERVLRAPIAGNFVSDVQIGQQVSAGAVIGSVADVPVIAQISGVVRGLIAPGTPVAANLKVGDIDPRSDASHCFTISDKSRAIGGGVLEAIMHLSRSRRD